MVDFITKLPLVAEKNAILVVCDRLFKIAHFIATMEGTSAERLVRLFRDNMWKLHGLLESVVLDKELQFVMELTKKLNRMLGIRTKLSIFFHSQIDGQTKCMNQKFKQYLQFFVNHKQKGWPEWLVMANFAVNKIYSATKVSLFMANYSRELRIEADIRRREKVKKMTEFIKKNKESTGKSCNSIKESIGRDEKISR